MKYSHVCVLGLMLLGIVVLGVSPAGAASSAGPYYATPAWDQKLDAPTRFIVLTNWNNEAVLDRETGLVWEKSPSPTVQNWSSAIHACYEKILGGRKGWHLPTIEQLTSLLDTSVAESPKLPAGHPFTGVQLSMYWSATTDPINAAVAWLVNFNVGDVNFYEKFGNGLGWCVRGGQGYDGR